MLIAPSILSSDFSELKENIGMLNRSACDWVHIDVMDGVFVPNISMGVPVLKGIKKICTKPLDVHLMIIDPDRYINDFKEAGAASITVHYEACIHLHRTIQKIREAGIHAGVAINPHTPVLFLSEILKDVSLVLVMSVNPGFGGQEFIENTFSKISQLRKLAEEKHATIRIEVDGGVNLQNASRLLQSGADVLVVGSAIFSSNEPLNVITALKNTQRPGSFA